MSTLTADQPLTSRLNIGEVTSWRLHWLLCDLWNLQHDIPLMNSGGRVAQLYAGAFAQALERVKRVEGAYQRLRWETKTMLGFDYDNEVDSLFASVAKNADYLSELAKTKALLQGIVDRVTASEAKHLQDSITQLGHSLS